MALELFNSDSAVKSIYLFDGQRVIQCPNQK